MEVMRPHLAAAPNIGLDTGMEDAREKQGDAHLAIRRAAIGDATRPKLEAVTRHLIDAAIRTRSQRLRPNLMPPTTNDLPRKRVPERRNGVGVVGDWLACPDTILCRPEATSNPA